MTAALAEARGCSMSCWTLALRSPTPMGARCCSYACEGGSELIVRTLLTAGADLTSRGNQGMTAVMLAARGGSSGSGPGPHRGGSRRECESGPGPRGDDGPSLRGARRLGRNRQHFARCRAPMRTTVPMSSRCCLPPWVPEEWKCSNLLLEAGARVDVTNGQRGHAAVDGQAAQSARDGGTVAGGGCAGTLTIPFPSVLARRTPRRLTFERGAEGGTRTPTTLRPPAPQAGSFAVLMWTGADSIDGS